MIKKIFLVILLLMITALPVYAKEIDYELNYYFYTDGCLSCLELEEKIDNVKNLNKYNLNNNENIEMAKQILNFYNYDEGLKTPLLIYDKEIYMGENKIQGFFNNKSPYTIPLLGFIDGLNPCAIAILMIFSSFLIITDKKKKLIFIGLSFIFGETLTNFLLGLGILKLSNFFTDFKLFSIIIYILSLVMCLYVIIINFIDIFNGFRNKNEIKNKLSINIKYKISEIIQKNINSKILIVTAFFMGLIIAVLEFGCTGQLYLPTILVLDQFTVNSLISLIVYNLMFALPLIIFLFLSLIFKPENIKNKVMKYSYVIKIVVNIVLILLFILILKRI